MSKPGVVLRRPVGSNGTFKEHANLPTHLSRKAVKGRSAKAPAKLKRPPRKIDEKAARQAALVFEKEQKRRDSERRKEEATAAKQRERRERASRKRRMPAGRGRKKNFRGLCGERETRGNNAPRSVRRGQIHERVIGRPAARMRERHPKDRCKTS